MKPINRPCANNFRCQNVQFQTIGKISANHEHKKNMDFQRNYAGLKGKT